MKMQEASFPCKGPYGEPVLGSWEGGGFIAVLFDQFGTPRLTVLREPYSNEPMSWEELMAVKDACGLGEFEAVEVYPASSFAINTRNHRHLYFIGKLNFSLKTPPGLQGGNPTGDSNG